jgi:DNA-binding MarR family transcriptional regulator
MYEAKLRLARTAELAGPIIFQDHEHPLPVTAAEVDLIWHQRRKRHLHFPEGLFADPAWDMLLTLYAAKLAGRRTTVKEVIRAAHVPATTGLRWLGKLVRLGLCRKIPDAMDARRQYVTLTPLGRAAMGSFFSSLEGDGRGGLSSYT